ncbi:hypothetical protein D9M72_577730 [compost metagenome]
MAAQAADLGRRGAQRQFRGQRGLDHAAGLEDFARLVDRGARHEGAAVGHQRNQLFMREAGEHLPDAGAAGAGDLAQALFHQLGAGQQAVLHDRGQQAKVDGLGGGGFAGGGLVAGGFFR